MGETKRMLLQVDGETLLILILSRGQTGAPWRHHVRVSEVYPDYDVAAEVSGYIERTLPLEIPDDKLTEALAVAMSNAFAESGAFQRQQQAGSKPSVRFVDAV